MLHRFLTTANTQGSLDFISNLIELNNYDSKAKNDIEKIINQDIKSIFFNSKFQENILSLIYHEITHFLDLTTTLWGLEYNSRKILFIKNQILSNKKINALDVFKLNVSEIEIHNELIKRHQNNKKINIYECELRHQLIYHERYSALVSVDFIYEKELIISVPFSMLSLLEANAISTEYLIKLNNISNENKETRKISFITLEKEFLNMLNNDNLLEYNLILILLKKHFTFLSLKELLIFTKVLVKYILNLSTMEISMISTLIKYTNINTYIGNAIVKDMQRGMSRHIVLFKFIFMIYEYMKPNQNYKFNTKHDLKYNPKLFLKNFINEFIGQYLKNFEIQFTKDTEFKIYIELLEKSKGILDSSIILESYNTNYNILKNNFEFECNIVDLKLLDIFLNDGNIIEFPNRINVDIEQYFDSNIDLLNKIEKSFKKSDMIKTHIHPADVTHV